MQFDACEAQSNKLTELKLPLPAYEQVLRASHIFNLLDARRTIGVTERAVYIGRVRKLARNVAQSYFESRQSKNFPRLRDSAIAAPRKSPSTTELSAPDQLEFSAPLLVEIGTEELPPQAISKLGAAFECELKRALSEVQIIASVDEPSNWFATPRRIAVAIENVQSRRDDVEQIKGDRPLKRHLKQMGLHRGRRRVLPEPVVLHSMHLKRWKPKMASFWLSVSLNTENRLQN